MKFDIEIITPKGIYLKDSIDSLTIKLSSGYRTFLKGHLPLIGTVEIAPMHFVKDGKVFYYAVFGGIINVKKEKIELVLDNIEEASIINKNRAELSKNRSEKRLSENDTNIDKNRAKLALIRAETRLKTLDLSEKN